MSNGLFKNDLEYGLKYEARAREKIINKYNYKIIKISVGNFPLYDFKALTNKNKKIKYEAKTTLGNYSCIYIEFKNQNDKPSGISISDAHYYIFVDVSQDSDDYYLIKTSILKQIIELHTIKIVPNKYKNSWGYIIDKNIIIASSELL